MRRTLALRRVHIVTRAAYATGARAPLEWAAIYARLSLFLGARGNYYHAHAFTIRSLFRSALRLMFSSFSSPLKTLPVLAFAPLHLCASVLLCSRLGAALDSPLTRLSSALVFLFCSRLGLVCVSHSSRSTPTVICYTVNDKIVQLVLLPHLNRRPNQSS